MAFNYYIVTPCNGGGSINIKTTEPLTSGLIYELTIGSSVACYTIANGFETPLAQSATVFSGPWNSCLDCISDLTPTPTSSPTNTPTPTGTPANTPTKTGTPAPTPTQTQTPTRTAAATPTPTQTGTPASTPTQTQTKTPTPTGTAAVTPTPTGTAAVTPTPTGTAASTPTPTPTPSTTPYFVISADTFYEFTNQIAGSYSGGTWDPSLGDIPHPVYTDENGNISIIQLNAVALGGFNGLNN